MDEWHFEIAARAEESARADALDKIRIRQCTRFPEWDGETCLTCGEELPPARIADGRVFCVHHQEVRERQGIRD